MNLKDKIIFYLLLVLLSFSWGCSKRAEKPAPPSAVVAVMFSPSLGDPSLWRRTMEQISRKENIRLLWREWSQDSEKQLRILLKGKADAVILGFGPGDPQEEARAAAGKVSGAGSRLVVVGCLPPDTPADAWLTFDGSTIGEVQGDFVKDRLPRGGKVLFLKMEKGLEFTGQEEGLESVIPGVKVVKVVVAQPQEVPDLVVSETGQDIRAIVAPSVLMKEVLPVAGGGKELVTVGLGAIKDHLQAITKGEHGAEVDLSPETSARAALRAAVQLVSDGRWDDQKMVRNGSYEVPAAFLPVRLITKENLSVVAKRYDSLGGNQGQKGAIEEGRQGETSGEEKGSSSGQGSTENPGGEEEPKKYTITIQLSGGKTMSVDVPGEVQSLEIKEAGKEEKPSSGS